MELIALSHSCGESGHIQLLGLMSDFKQWSLYVNMLFADYVHLYHFLLPTEFLLSNHIFIIMTCLITFIF